MDTGAPSNRNHEAAPQTLGEILYADKSATRVSEADWESLVRAIAAGDQLALHTLYEHSHRIVFTLIVRITSNRETAEEVTLDVFHEIWQNAGRYDPGNGSVVGWIMNRARSRAIDRLRFEHRKKRSGDGPDSPLDTAPAGDPQHAYVMEEQNRQLRGALGLLSADERQAIETAFFSELTYQETAANLRLPLGTVKTRIRSGLAKLRQNLTGMVNNG